MKKLIYLSLFFIGIDVCAQAPSKFNYQAVARDNSGNPLSNKLISIRLSILNTSPSGPEVYKETFLISTNEFGHFNIPIGGGSSILGSIESVNWNAEDKYLKIEMDATGGTNYVLMGSTQLLSVPYALNSKYTSNISPNAKFNLDQLNGGSAIIGQVLIWNGSSWMPTSLSSASGDNWGTQSVQVGNTLSGNGTSTNKLNLAQQGAIVGQILQWNGTTWVPATIATGGSDNWGTQTVASNLTMTGNGTSASPLGLSQQGATNGQVLKWNGTTWIPANETGSDNWGSQSTVTNSTLSGTGTSTSPLSIASQGASNGQVLQWNGSTWAPASISGGVGDNWGTQVVQTNASLSGSGTSSNPLKLAQQSATTGQLLQWSGTAWVPVTLTGDNWGSQSTVTSGAISGNGTTTLPIILAQQSATNGQVLKWNGTAWLPKNDSLGWGIQVAATNTTLAGNGTITTPLAIAQQGAANGQVLKWNGSTWLPANDSIGSGGGGSYTSSNGLTLTGSNFALGGTLSGPTIINTSQTNNLALTGLWTGFDTDSVLTSNAANGIINRQSRDRVNYWKKNGLGDISYTQGKVSIGSTVPVSNFYVEHNTTAWDTTVYIRTTNTSSTPTGNTSIIVDNINSNLSAGIGVRASAGYIGILGRGVGVSNNAAGTHIGLSGIATGNTLGINYGVLAFADTSGFSIGTRTSGGASGLVSNVDVENTNFISVPFVSHNPFKPSILGYTSGNNLNFGTSNIGVTGIANSTNTFINCGIYGVGKSANYTNSISIGVSAEAFGGSIYQLGIYSFIDTPYYTGSIKRSGLFIDTFEVLGTLKKTSGTFRIDHPLDPANKFLDHSFVESPDMMNIYNGTIVTDSKGYATVKLPNYFMALNMDFRYQLTAIGEFSQVIVKEKIKDNTFIIQSEKPNIEISWQVTGVRNDPYAAKHRIKDEVEKTGFQKGKYLYPELYNQPAEKGIYYQLRKESRDKVEDKNNTWDKIKNPESIK